MNPQQATNKNFLILTKYFNKQPKQKIITSYLANQFVFLSSKHTTITFLEFYNFINLPFELSLRLFKTLTKTKVTKLEPEELTISFNDFVLGLSRLYSDVTVEKKIEIAIEFLSLSNDPDKIYKDDIVILFTQFHVIKNNDNLSAVLNNIIDDFFGTDKYLTLPQFRQRSFFDNSTLLYLVLFYLVYYRPFKIESIDFYEKYVFKKEKGKNELY